MIPDYSSCCEDCAFLCLDCIEGCSRDPVPVFGFTRYSVRVVDPDTGDSYVVAGDLGDVPLLVDVLDIWDIPVFPFYTALRYYRYLVKSNPIVRICAVK